MIISFENDMEWTKVLLVYDGSIEGIMIAVWIISSLHPGAVRQRRNVYSLNAIATFLTSVVFAHQWCSPDLLRMVPAPVRLTPKQNGC
jgi:hypothetical protein